MNRNQRLDRFVGTWLPRALSFIGLQLALLLFLSTCAPTAFAQPNAAASGNWDTGSTWNPAAEPTAVSNAGIFSGFTVTMNSAGNTADALTAGNSTGAGTLTLNSGAGLTVNNLNLGISGANAGTVNHNDGVLTINNNLNYGAAGVGQGGTYNLNGGTLNVLGNIVETAAAVPSAQLYLNGGTLNVTGNITVQSFRVGDTGNATYTLAAGKTITNTGTFFVAQATGTTGSFTMNGPSSLLTVNNRLQVADKGTANGTFNLLGGTVNVTGGGMFLAGDGTNGTLTANPNTVANMLIGTVGGNLTDAQLTITGTNFEVGRSGTATVSQRSGTVTVTGANFVLAQASTASATYNLSGGALNANNDMNFNSGVAQFNQSGGAVTVGGTLNVASVTGGDATYAMTGGTLNIGSRVLVGSVGTANGKFYLDAGIVNANGGIYLAGDSAGSATGNPNTVATMTIGTIGGNLTDAQLTSSTTNFEVGRSGTAIVTQHSGTVTVTSGNLVLSQGSTAKGTYNLVGGQLQVNTVINFNAGNSTFNQSGGTADIVGSLNLANTSSGTSLYNLTGGTLSVNGITNANAAFNTTFTLNGGTLNLQGNSFSADTINLQSGTLMNVSEVNSGGAINKSTTGTLIIQGTNNFSGTLNINAGVLAANSNTALGTSAAATTVSIGAQLLITGGRTIAGEQINIGGAGTGSSVGALRSSTGTNTLNGLLNLYNDATVFVESGSTLNLAGGVQGFIGTPPVRVLTLDGPGTGNITGAIAPGAGFGTVVKNGAGTWNLSHSSNAWSSGGLVVNQGVLVVGAAEVIPHGSGKGDVALNSPGVLDVQFDETINGLSGGGTVDKSTAGSITFTVGSNNASSNFAGVVQNSGGTLALTKTGTGTLELSGGAANTYSGGTNVAGGVLKISKNAALGSVADGTTVDSGASLQLAGGLSYAAPESLSINGSGYAGISPNTAALFVDDGGTASFAGPIAAVTSASIGAFNGSTLNLGGSLSKNGTTLTFVGNGAANFININGGISGAAANSDLIVDNVTTNINSLADYNGPTFVRNSGVLQMGVGGGVITTALTVGAADAGPGAEIGTVNHSVGTIAVSGNAIIGEATGSAGSSYNLSGSGVLTFGDTLATTQMPDNAASTLTIGANGDFNFTGGTLSNVSFIDVTNAPNQLGAQYAQTFLQEGGDFVIGNDGVSDTANAVRATTQIIGGDFHQMAGTLSVDVYGTASVHVGEVGNNNFPPLETESDLLIVDGDIYLNGVLDVNFNGLQAPTFGWYDVAIATTISTGTAFQVNGATLYQIVDDPLGSGRQVLQVATPEPASLAAWAIAAICLLGLIRRIRGAKPNGGASNTKR